MPCSAQAGQMAGLKGGRPLAAEPDYRIQHSDERAEQYRFFVASTPYTNSNVLVMMVAAIIRQTMARGSCLCIELPLKLCKPQQCPTMPTPCCLSKDSLGKCARELWACNSSSSMRAQSCTPGLAVAGPAFVA